MLPPHRGLWQHVPKLIILSSVLSHCLCNLQSSHNVTSRHALEKRSFTTQDSSGSGSTGLSSGGYQLKDPCGKMDISPQTWVDLQIDQYLQSYPGADKLTIQEFAAELNVPNFFCGVGLDCFSGQLCSPARGINWLILYAAQEWNNYMNAIYKATEQAISSMRDASSDIVSDFMPHEGAQGGLYGWSVATVIVGALASFTALAVPALLPANAIQLVTDAGKAGAGAGFLGATGVPTAGMAMDTHQLAKASADGLEALKAQKPADLLKAQEMYDQAVTDGFIKSLRTQPHPRPATQTSAAAGHPSAPSGPSPSPPESPKHVKRALSPEETPKKRHPSPAAFTRWSYLSTHLTVLQRSLQSWVASSMKAATKQPLLSDGGMASILSQGYFLYPSPTQGQLSDDFKALAQLTALSQFFKSIKMFVTIGSDDCKHGGPNGAKNGPQDLSFCSKDGLMMNIVRAEGNKVVNKIENAHLLKTKYKYTVEYLATAAWDCQKKYGLDSENTAPPPFSVKSDCVFSIPVCDCTLPEVARLRHKKKGTVKACRKGAGLPI